MLMFSGTTFGMYDLRTEYSCSSKLNNLLQQLKIRSIMLQNGYPKHVVNCYHPKVAKL